MPLKYKLYVNFSYSEEESVKDEGSQQDEVKSELKEIIDEPSLNSEKEDVVDSNISTAQLNKVTPISRNTNMDSTTKNDNVKGKKRLRIGFEGELSASPKMRVNIKLNRSQCSEATDFQVQGLLRKLHYLHSFANIEIKSAPEVHQFLAQIMKKECVLPEYFVQAKEPFHTSTESTKFVEASELKRSLLKEIRSKSGCRYPQSKQICEVIYKRFTRLLQENAFVPVLPHLQQFTAGAQYVEGLTSGAGYLHPHLAADVRKWLETLLEQKIYCQHLRPKWTLILMDLDCPWDKVAGFLISELDSEANSEIQKTKLSQVAELFRKNRKSEKNRLLIDQIMISMVSVPNSKFFPTVTVEGTKGSKLEIAGAYYRKFKYTHWMSFGNKVLPTLFSLLFWDIIYHGDVNAAFISDIQYIPLDMYCNFYKNRKVHIEKRLEEINSLWENEELNNFIRKVWKRHSHEKCLICPDIFRNDINNIILLIKIFGRKKISKVLRRYIMNCPETEVCFQTYLPIVKREIGINLY